MSYKSFRIPRFPTASVGPSKLIVVATCCKKINIFIITFINHTIFLTNAAGPQTRKIMFQWLGFACSDVWVISEQFFQISAKSFMQLFIFQPQLFVGNPCIC